MITDEALLALGAAGPVTVETVDGERITGIFDGAFTIDAEPERGVVGIQICLPPTVRPGFPVPRYIERENIAEVFDNA
jgi:hypothetical protein